MKRLLKEARFKFKFIESKHCFEVQTWYSGVVILSPSTNEDGIHVYFNDKALGKSRPEHVITF